MAENTNDTRSVKTVLAQWRKLEEIRRQLTKAGKLSADAAPTDVIEKLRECLPPSVFG